MHKVYAVLSVVALFVSSTCAAFGQGFGDYVAPQTSATAAQNENVGVPIQSVEAAKQAGIAVARPAAQNPQNARVAQPTVKRVGTTSANLQAPAAQTPTDARNVPAQSSDHSAQTGGVLGGYVESDEIVSAIVDPPATYKPTEEEQTKLDEFLKRWEDFGKNIKRISCDVHMREYDGVLQKNDERPVAHTWGQFRYISPNKLMYHIKGEFVYTDANPKGEWKESQNEWKIVLNSKELVQYDYKNKNVVVYPIAEEEQDMDLTMDNGQFPLFFVAKANVLKSRFYLRLVTPKARQDSEVWIEAFPRYARDAQQFQSIVVLLSLKDLQPTYMRKIGVNGKSKTDLKFENISVNKGLWTIEGTVDPGWTKDVREEKFSIMRQQPMAVENAVANAPQRPATNNVPPTASRTRANAQNAPARTARQSAPGSEKRF